MSRAVIDAVKQKARIRELEAALEVERKRAERAELEAADRKSTLGDLCDSLWGAMYGEDVKGNWEYPAQAVRRVKDFIKERAEFRADRDAEKQRADHLEGALIGATASAKRRGADRDQQAALAGKLRAALEAVPHEGHCEMFVSQATWESVYPGKMRDCQCRVSIAKAALALTTPAAIDQLRRAAVAEWIRRSLKAGRVLEGSLSEVRCPMFDYHATEYMREELARLEAETTHG